MAVSAQELKNNQMARKVFGDARNIVSGFIHFGGMLLSIAGLVLMVVYAAKTGDPMRVVTFTIFGASLVLLYGASTFYHIFFISEHAHAIFRKIDHMMIFVLIAGTYTPVTLVGLSGWLGWTMFGVLWGLAAAGIVMKIFWMKAPRILYTIFYIIMGWIGVAAIFPLWQSISSMGIMWLLLGGVMYTIGGVCYALKWPPLNFKSFGFHELFHIFCLLGSFCHFVMMFWFVMGA